MFLRDIEGIKRGSVKTRRGEVERREKLTTKLNFFQEGRKEGRKEGKGSNVISLLQRYSSSNAFNKFSDTRYLEAKRPRKEK